MKILLVNKFFFPKGGSEISFFKTAEILENKGHQTIFLSMKHPKNLFSPYEAYFVSNVDFDGKDSIIGRFKNAIRIIYSIEARKKAVSLVEQHKPDLVHLHNYHHQISPSILSVFKKYNLPVVMTLHDYKVVCPAYTMFVGGETCDLCKHGRYYWCLLNRCTKDSFLKSAINMIEMYFQNSLLHVNRCIDIFISPSKFLMQKLKEMGFKNGIFFLPNIVYPRDYEPTYDFEEKSLVYFGRLSREKGLYTLINAAKKLSIGMKIIGDGPLRKELEEKVKTEKVKNVEFLGYLAGDHLKDEIRKAMAVVLPSEWYENNPITLIEAYALGKPVIGSKIGGIPELIIDDETGLTFEPKNTEDLTNKIMYLISNPDKIKQMGVNARRFVEDKLNPERYYSELMKIYQLALEKHR